MPVSVGANTNAAALMIGKLIICYKCFADFRRIFNDNILILGEKCADIIKQDHHEA